MFSRRLLKFLHTIGAIGFMGSMASFLVLLSVMPSPSAISEYALVRGAMGDIAKWVFLPSMGITLVAGLLSIAVTPVFHNAGWVWLKLATGIIVFEWSFVAIQGPIQAEAELSARVLAGQGNIAELALTLGAERNSLWVMLALAAANVLVGIWRPRLTNLKD